MPPSEPPRHDEPNRLGRVSKNAAFLMMMALLLLLAIRLVGSQDQAVVELTYTQFMGHLRDDRIDNVVFGERVVEGEFRGPVRIENQNFVHFHTCRPIVPQQTLMDQLDSRGVVVTAEAAQRGVGALLITLLPWL